MNEAGGVSEPKPTEHVCDKCGKYMVVRSGRYGEFLACSGYPECKNARPLPLGIACPKCGRDVIEVRGKKRGKKSFFGCAGYPECDFKLWQKPVAEACPQCSSPYLLRMGGEKNPKLACPDKNCGFSRKLTTNDGDEPPPEFEPKPMPRDSVAHRSHHPSVAADPVVG